MSSARGEPGLAVKLANIYGVDQLPSPSNAFSDQLDQAPFSTHASYADNFHKRASYPALHASWLSDRRPLVRSHLRSFTTSANYAFRIIRLPSKVSSDRTSPRRDRVSRKPSPNYRRGDTQNQSSATSVTTNEFTQAKTAKQKTIMNHLTSAGEAHMVDITEKAETARSATAISSIAFSRLDTIDALEAATVNKGDALAVARVAGIQAAKQTPSMIPLAHPNLGITGVEIKITPFDSGLTASTSDSTLFQQYGLTPALCRASHVEFGGVFVTAIVKCHGKTGVEMEALTAASTTALTLYDMLKGIDKGMQILNTRIIAKSGGKSGNWTWDLAQNKLSVDSVSRKTPAPKQVTLATPQIPEATLSASKSASQPRSDTAVDSMFVVAAEKYAENQRKRRGRDGAEAEAGA